MATITYIEHNGTRHEIVVQDGSSVMQGAYDNMLEGMAGECGGGCACATCHCYVDDAWMDKVGQPSEPESDMLEFSACERKPTSRLSCQITVTPELDGLVVYLPESQY